MLAEAVGLAVVNYVEPDTRSTQATAVGKYVMFWTIRDVDPWPVSRWSLACWMWDRASLMALSSLLRGYVPALKRAVVTRNDEWGLDGDPFIQRVVVALKKKYGMPGKKPKVALTLAIILKVAKRLPGFPYVRCMYPDDRLWLFASVMGCLGMLRGGEFLTSPKQSRPILMAGDLTIVRVTQARSALVVQVAKPKARWWEVRAPVSIMELPGTALDIVHLYTEYVRLSPWEHCPGDAALRRQDGSILSKAWMFDKTDKLLWGANIFMVNKLGRRMLTGAKSWRAGGVMSAKAAKCDVEYTKAQGAWNTSAHLCYTSELQIEDFQHASARIWEAACTPRVEEVGSLPLEYVVEECDSGPDALGIDPSTTMLTQNMVPAEPPSREVLKKGAKVFTEWGTATVKRRRKNGSYLCSWPGIRDSYALWLYDEGAAIPDGAAKELVIMAAKGLTSETSRVLPEAMEVVQVE